MIDQTVEVKIRDQWQMLWREEPDTRMIFQLCKKHVFHSLALPGPVKNVVNLQRGSEESTGVELEDKAGVSVWRGV